MRLQRYAEQAPERRQVPVNGGNRCLGELAVRDKFCDHIKLDLVEPHLRHFGKRYQVFSAVLVELNSAGFRSVVGANVRKELFAGKFLERGDRRTVPDANFTLRQSRLPGRFDLFRYAFVGLLRTLPDLLAVPSELEPPSVTALVDCHGG